MSRGFYPPVKDEVETEPLDILSCDVCGEPAVMPLHWKYVCDKVRCESEIEFQHLLRTNPEFRRAMETRVDDAI